MKDSKNLLLILLCAGLMGTWIYHLYDKSHYRNHQVAVLIKDSMATQEAIKDSLRKLLDEKNMELDTTKTLASSVQKSRDSIMTKVYDLRNQITDILKNRSATKEDLKKARDLIKEYREQIDQMKNENTDLETERTRLNGVLTQLNDEMKGLQDNITRVTAENKEMAETINQASIFIASDFQFSAITTKSGDREVESSSAKKTNKFVFSFIIQNNVVKTGFYDAYIVIMQPNKKVLQNDVWGAEYFTSKTEGTKAYTSKIRFEYNRGEKRKVIYTVDTKDLIAGQYQLQVYQNGVMIGEANKSLN